MEKLKKAVIGILKGLIMLTILLSIIYFVGPSILSISNYACDEQINYNFIERTTFQVGEKQMITGSYYALNISNIVDGEPRKAAIEIYSVSGNLTTAQILDRVHLAEGNLASIYPGFRIKLHEVSIGSVNMSIDFIERSSSRIESFFFD
jgi:hypothetical protein